MPTSDNHIKFTLKWLAAIVPMESPQFFYDSGCPGLGVRVSPKGKKTFFWRDGARRVNLKTTRLDEARRQVRERQASREEFAEASDWTLQHVFELWMENKAKPHKRTWERDASRYKQYLERWGKRRLESIKRLEVIQLHNQIRDKSGPYAANDTLAFLSSLYNYAERFDFMGRNPCKFVDRFPEQERERYLLPEEFPRWYAAVQALKVPTARDFFLLALWTGIRRQAVISMRWDQIDMEARTWRIPREADKGKRDRIVFLSEPAMEVLTVRQKIADSEWVFPSRNGAKSGHYSDPKSAWKSVLKHSGITNLRVHDLRRTLGSWMANCGTSLHIIGDALQHKSPQATRIYARLGGDAVRDAVNEATRAMLDTILPPREN